MFKSHVARFCSSVRRLPLWPNDELNWKAIKIQIDAQFMDEDDHDVLLENIWSAGSSD